MPGIPAQSRVLSSSERNLSGPGGEKEPGEGGEGPKVTPASKRSAPPLEIPVCSRSPERRGSVCCVARTGQLSLPLCPALSALTPWRFKNLAAPLLPLTLT